MDSKIAAVTELDIPNLGLDKRSLETIEQSFESLLVILTTFSGIILARVLTHRLCTRVSLSVCYLVEFPLIMLPGILFVTVASSYCVYFIMLMILLSAWFILRSRSIPRARSRAYIDLGSRPNVLTIVRALTHLITAICILAIDFNSFHRPYRKSRFFGAQLMDTGIGLFVVTMGLVSRRPRHWSDLRRNLLYSALPLIMLGIARVVAIVAIGYGQDEHEYGRHLNAFFTLGFTKFLGSLLSFLAHSDTQLLPLALGVVVTHQLGLSFGGLSKYVMDDDLPRSTLLSANREGILSLPGFVAIYLLAIFLSRWLFSKTLLSYAELLRKLRKLFLISVLCWLLMVVSAYAIGVSRVTCNFGYVVWMLAIVSTMLGLSLFAFDLVINSVLPIDTNSAPAESLEKGSLLSTRRTQEGSTTKDVSGVFVICESLNMNGLTFFLLANILTGGVNIFLKPENRSDFSSIVILLVYMMLATYVVHQLCRKRIRIA